MKRAPAPCLMGYLRIDCCKDLECLMVEEEAKERTFQSLELSVVDCEGMEWNGMEEIIEENVEDNGLINLRNVKLKGLPKLILVCYAMPCNEVLGWESLEWVDIGRCPMLKKLPSGLRTAKRIQTIKVEREWL
ncbi:hypothetical protein AMTR_s00029p00115670 [Amborella trichopoda]|uniref:NB-ARC domain-containing protein n=1 Tax=Amborella trichopoda TaxID=13333 RepID=W1PP44_AMBTC|nr:hypothetical protein AMTR_s00029p00115670 [Amborella trichopoda]